MKGRLALCEPKSLAVEDGEYSKQAPQTLLAHPTVTIANFIWLPRHFVSDCATHASTCMFFLLI